MRNPDLDIDDLARKFAVKRRLQIRNVFIPESASDAQRCLANEVPWDYVFRRDGKEIVMSPADISSASAIERAEIAQQIIRDAKRGFQFAFFKYSMVDAYRSGRNQDLFLHQVLESIAAKPFIDFARKVTGDDRIARIDAQATLYDPGNFLTVHDDKSFDGHTRLYAYVLNFSRDWLADWGGLLQFHSASGDVEESFVPHFNSMSFFAVPTRHSVSMVTAFAGSPRLAVTGWFTA